MILNTIVIDYNIESMNLLRFPILQFIKQLILKSFCTEKGHAIDVLCL